MVTFNLTNKNMDTQSLKFSTIELAMKILTYTGQPFTYKDVLKVATELEKYISR